MRARCEEDDRVRWFISSANRDPAMFANADTFDIKTGGPTSMSRSARAFIHCLAHLARVEGQEVFKALAERFLRLPARQPGARKSAEHHLPVAEIAADQLAVGQLQIGAAMAKKVRVRVDHNLCVGNAMCETFAPHVSGSTTTASRKRSIPGRRPFEQNHGGCGELPDERDHGRGRGDREQLFP